jgi:hypothetical protein
VTVEELRDLLIEDGIAEVERVYEEDDRRRAGAIEGFELCRSLGSPSEFRKVLDARQRREDRWVREFYANERIREDDYWRHRYATLQVEFVYNVLRVGWIQSGVLPNGEISARAGIKYAAIVGVEEA